MMVINPTFNIYKIIKKNPMVKAKSEYRGSFDKIPSTDVKPEQSVIKIQNCTSDDDNDKVDFEIQDRTSDDDEWSSDDDEWSNDDDEWSNDDDEWSNDHDYVRDTSHYSANYSAPGWPAWLIFVLLSLIFIQILYGWLFDKTDSGSGSGE